VTGDGAGLEQLLADAFTVPVGEDEREAGRLRLGDAACAVELGSTLTQWRAAARAFGRLADGTPSGLGVAGELAACCRLTEIDDIHLASCTTPGSVTVPAALAAVLAGASPHGALDGIVVGYAVAAGAGELLGGALLPPGTLWVTRAVAPIAAAATTARSLGLSTEECLDACALAAGVLVDGSLPEPGRAFSLAMAVGAGMEAAAAAAEGMQADRGRMQAWGRGIAGAAGATTAVRPSRAGGAAVLESRLKPYAGARQVLAASSGLRALVESGEIRPGDVERVEAGVPALHAAMVERRELRHRLDTLASAQYQLSLALETPGRLDELEHELPPPPRVGERMRTIDVVGAEELEEVFPERWGASLVLRVAGGEQRVDIGGVPGEEGFGWDELGEKAARLGAANGGAGGALALLLRHARAGELAAVAEELVASLSTARKGAT
jgi:2-methylcitrate dehydratase PrpD